MGMFERPTCPDCGYHFPYLAGSIFTNPILHISGKPITCPQCRSTTLGEKIIDDIKSFKRENKFPWDKLKKDARKGAWVLGLGILFAILLRFLGLAP